MDGKENFFSIRDLERGITRELATGLSARIFVGEQVMLSVVTIEPRAHGNVHNHSEE